MDQRKKNLKPLIKALLPIGLVGLVMNILVLFLPFFSIYSFEFALPSSDISSVTWLALLVIIAFIIYGVCDSVRSIMLQKCSNWIDNLGYDLMKNSFKNDTVKAFQGIQQLKNFYSSSALPSLLDIPWVPLFILAAFSLHEWFGYLALFGTLLLLILAWGIDILSKENFQKSFDYHQERKSDLISFFRYNEYSKILGINYIFEKKYLDTTELYQKYNNKAQTTVIVVWSAARALRLALQLICIWGGILLVLNEQTSIGALIAANILVTRCFLPAESALSSWRHFIQARQGWVYLEKSLSQIENKTSLPLKPVGNIEIQDLKYEVNKKKILDISGNIKIEKGTITSIIGSSGSGKTTLLKIMVGIIEQSEGSIKIDNYKIREYEENISKIIGYLPQPTVFIKGSVAQNISQDYYLEEKVLNAIDHCLLNEMIGELDGGYNFQVEDGGWPLSGGQKQKIGLAKAMYHDPNILILDEPTSGLTGVDIKNFTEFLKKQKERGKTIILVTHTSALLQFTDQILVLKNGQNSFYGTPTQFLEISKS